MYGKGGMRGGAAKKNKKRTAGGLLSHAGKALTNMATSGDKQHAASLAAIDGGTKSRGGASGGQESMPTPESTTSIPNLSPLAKGLGTRLQGIFSKNKRKKNGRS